jgi:hypothetical protein
LRVARTTPPDFTRSRNRRFILRMRPCYILTLTPAGGAALLATGKHSLGQRWILRHVFPALAALCVHLNPFTCVRAAFAAIVALRAPYLAGESEKD